MGKRNLGVIKTIDVDVNKESFEALDAIISDKGGDLVSKTELNSSYVVEYNAEYLTSSWDEVEDAILDEFEDASVDLDWGDYDEEYEDETMSFESLAITI